jgi:3-oxoacyl-[acyl-carrier-protein] synthase-3
LERFGISENFVKDKIGFLKTLIKNPHEETSDLCVNAYKDLQHKINFSNDDIDCLVVCTQNPDDFGLPHTSAIVHGKLGLSQDCAAFDISLGCSGYVYSLSILMSFMTMNKLNNGILITADPYSKIVDETDKNTKLLFGDAATASFISTNKVTGSWNFGKFGFGSDGSLNKAIHVDKESRKLVMNGRSVFNFSATVIPEHITKTLRKNDLTIKEIDKFLLHQGSYYLVKTIQEKLNLPSEKCPFDAVNLGNTVSSSIPLLMNNLSPEDKQILLCGFGVGLSWGSCVLLRENEYGEE